MFIVDDLAFTALGAVGFTAVGPAAGMPQLICAASFVYKSFIPTQPLNTYSAHSCFLFASDFMT